MFEFIKTLNNFGLPRFALQYFVFLQKDLATFTTIYHNNLIKNNCHKSHITNMDLSKQGKHNNEEAERLARRNERGRQRRLDHMRLLKKEKFVWQSVKKHKKTKLQKQKVSKKSIKESVCNKQKLQSEKALSIYTCVLMLYKGRRSRAPPVYSLFKFQSKFMFCKCKTVFLLLYFKILTDFTCKRI